MRPSARLRRSLIATAAFAGLALVFAAVPAHAEDAEVGLTGMDYVALGDSYSAGFGLLPYSEEPAAGCYQADHNYPHLVATALGLELNDRTCSGAVTANIRDVPQVTITGAGTAPVQSESLSTETDLVTVTIGGNDLGFAGVAEFCLAEAAAGPLWIQLLQNCKEYYAPVVDGFELDSLRYLLDSTVAPALDETFALIASKAPNAKVFVIGYPTISPDFEHVPPAGCFSDALGNGSPPFPQNAFPFTDVDRGYIHGIEAALDTAIQDAAEAHGATYVSTFEASAAHSACAVDGEAYVNGISLVTHGQGTPTPDPLIDVKLGALHPNESGVAFLASMVTAAIEAEFGGEVDPPQPSDSGEESSEAAAAQPPAQLPATGVSATPWMLAAGSTLLGAALLISARRRRPSSPAAPLRHALRQ